MFSLLPYGRIAAVRYAHRWAYSRNPMYYDYENIGGDCTNFVSQCLYAGGALMNYTPTFGWYYINGSNKAPAWTGVDYLYRFLRRETPSVGPAAEEVTLDQLMPGDIVQLSFDGHAWQHSPLVVYASSAASPWDVLVAAHSADADYRPLATYSYQNARYLHVTGVYIESGAVG